jgi:hypothetical protein
MGNIYFLMNHEYQVKWQILFDAEAIIVTRWRSEFILNILKAVYTNVLMQLWILEIVVCCFVFYSITHNKTEFSRSWSSTMIIKDLMFESSMPLIYLHCREQTKMHFNGNWWKNNALVSNQIQIPKYKKLFTKCLCK